MKRKPITNILNNTQYQQLYDTYVVLIIFMIYEFL